MRKQDNRRLINVTHLESGSKFASVTSLSHQKWYPSDAWFLQYTVGKLKPNYPVPSTIGFQHTRLGTYLFDTRKGFDGMPLFRGYTWDEWNK